MNSLKLAKLIFFITLLLSSFSNLYASELSCIEILSEKNNSLIYFYNDTLARGFLTLEDLRSVKISLENGDPLLNPFVNSSDQRDSASQLIRSANFITAVNQGYSTEVLLDWVNNKILELEVEVNEKEKAHQDTSGYHEPAVFNHIKAGKFTYTTDEVSPTREVELLQDFEMQSTHVSQGQWLKVMNANPSSNQRGSYDKVMNNPVENITFWSALVFANRLSIKEGLKPVYDLSEFDFKGSPELGTLEINLNPNNMPQIKINAPGGDLYKAEGYRLPTKAEFYMVITRRGELGKSRDFHRYFQLHNEAAMFGNVAFTSGLSGTMPSASVPPYYSNGHGFYDLFVNVCTFTTEMKSDPPKFSYSQRNPSKLEIEYSMARTFLDKELRVSIISTASPNDGLLFYEDQGQPANSQQGFTGIRLVRSLIGEHK